MTRQKRELLKKLELQVKKALSQAESGHDYWHVCRVVAHTRKILKKERQADPFLSLAAAWLHDIKDWKFSGGDESAGPREAKRILRRLGLGTSQTEIVSEIVGQISFRGAKVKNLARRIEAKIVQDADRLDALGAIGIARCFAYGGARGRAIFEPGQAPQLHPSFSKYRRSQGSSINHFYEKLLLLKSKMNTQEGRRLSAKGDRILKEYLKAFLAEWKSGREGA